MVGAAVGVLISGIVQIYVTRKTLQNSQKEFEAKIQQMREEQRRVVLEELKRLFYAENTRFMITYGRKLHFMTDYLMNFII